MLAFDTFEALTFDCYGTLIDWEAGILSALRPVLAAHGVHRDDEALLALYAQIESQKQDATYRPYRTVLAGVMRSIGAALGLTLTDAEADSLARSLPGWPVFGDTVEALRVLKQRYRLAIVSNIDDDLFAGTAQRLQVPFDVVITAQHVRSYKPAPAHFLEAERRLALPRAQILHVAQSRYHDVAPAGALGYTTVWVNRQAGRPGATRPTEATPDLEVPDLRSLVALMGLA